jgi:DNA-binding NarL/FixJ family response regulator
MSSSWRVLVVEDDPTTREFFAQSVRGCEQLQLMGTAASVVEARAWLDDSGHTADVLLTDLGLPDGSGLQVIRHALQCNPQCEALVISMFGDEDNVLASIEAGATGYIHKDSAPGDVAQAIVQLKAGASPISPMIARRVLAKYRSMLGDLKQNEALAQQNIAQLAIDSVANNAPSAGPSVGSSDVTPLSPREQEVLELIARGFSYAEIAKLRYVSVHTVQTHIKNLYAKLAVHSKSEAVFEATRMGLLRL